MRLPLAVVLGAGGACGYNAAMCLASADWRLVLADLDGSRISPVLLEHAVAAYNAPAVDSLVRDAWEAELWARHRPDFVLALPDREVQRLYRSKWGGGLRHLPPEQHVALCSDKYMLCNHLRTMCKTGVETWLATENGWRDGPEWLWVRARRGAGSRAALPCRRDDVDWWVKYWAGHPTRRIAACDMIVSPVLPGEEYAVQLVYDHGVEVACFPRKRLEYVFGEQMPSGQSSSPSLAVTVDIGHECVDVARRSVAALGGVPNGIYGIDMKCDETGKPLVTEINAGRPYTTSLFAKAAGVNVVAKLGEVALGVSPVPCPPACAGVEWRRLMDAGPWLGRAQKASGRADCVQGVQNGPG